MQHSCGLLEQAQEQVSVLGQVLTAELEEFSILLGGCGVPQVAQLAFTQSYAEEVKFFILVMEIPLPESRIDFKCQAQYEDLMQQEKLTLSKENSMYKS